MDFQQFLADGPIQSLLALMAVPLLIAVILVGFLIFSFTRRTKKAKMKLGIQANSSFTENELEANIDTPSSDPLPKTTSENNISAAIAVDDLDLGILSNKVDGETIMEDSQKPSVEKNVDLAARLNTQTSAEDVQPAAITSVQKPVELLRLLRDSHSGQLIVEVSGEQYTKLADITDKKIGQFVLNVAAHFLAFTNGVIVTEAGIKNLGTPKVATVPQPIVEPLPASGLNPATPQQPQSDTSEKPLIPKPSPEAEAAFLASIQAMPLSEPPQPQKTGSFFSFGKSSSSASQPSGGFGLNLAEEINEIVQNRLRYSPLKETNRVDIQTEPSGGIRIVVNGQIYASADDIQDTEVRDLIKASIKEWEDK